MHAKTKRMLSGSLSSKIPPPAAITGTLSWTVAAVVALRKGSTLYQTI